MHPNIEQDSKLEIIVPNFRILLVDAKDYFANLSKDGVLQMSKMQKRWLQEYTFIPKCLTGSAQRHIFAMRAQLDGVSVARALDILNLFRDEKTRPRICAFGCGSSSDEYEMQQLYAFFDYMEHEIKKSNVIGNFPCSYMIFEHK